MGAVTLEFEGEGVLPVFPCSDCGVSFEGEASGAGHATSSDACCVLDPVWEWIGVVQHAGQFEAAFATTGPFAATARYGEPVGAYCPSLGAATGSATLSASATGVARRLDPPATGAVTSVTFSLRYSYQRAGAGTAVITSGDVHIRVRFPDETAVIALGSIGGGTGAFVVDPATARARCAQPGPLPFKVTGAVTMELY